MSQLVCTECHLAISDAQPAWRCRCGGTLLLEGTPLFPVADLRNRPTSLWRYRETLGVGDASVVSLGEGSTPLLDTHLEGNPVKVKLEFLAPTGSFKDRGTTVMISKLKEWGVTEVVDDSSGNAGASVAAYSAASGIHATVYIPAYASAGKAAQISLCGAKLVRVEGTREDTASRAWEAAQKTFYASHNWSPHFIAGMKTAAFEIAEQLGWCAPDWVVAPVGGGSLLIGLYLGFKQLVEHGVVSSMPRLAAVQPLYCSPVYQAWSAGLEDVPQVEKKETAAEGMAIVKPVRGKGILRAIRGTNGVACAVSERAIWQALVALAERGIYVEPTSAAIAAGFIELRRQGVIGPTERAVIMLTGTGLKATDKIAAHFG